VYNVMEEKKICNKCGQLKNISLFSRRSDKLDGHETICKACKKVYNKQYRELNSEKIKTQGKLYREENKVLIKQRKREYYLDNKSKILNKNKEYYKQNYDQIQQYQNYYRDKNKVILREKDKIYKQTYTQTEHFKILNRLKSQKRRILKFNQSDNTVNLDVFKYLLYEFKNCPYCGKSLTQDNKHIDHMRPLSKQGPHSKYNLIVCCNKCNSLKKDKPFKEWLSVIPENNRKRLQSYLAVRWV
jgi:5-methylcytosine-specific restriction endonuclease McrA